jgi:hypothetical protein
MAGRKVILEVEDWQGEQVRLYAAQWKHIRQEHREMADQLDAIGLTISDPDAVTRSDTLALDPDGERRVASRRDTHSRYSRLYVRVPIEYSAAGNWVTTAYVNPLPPKGDLLYVRLSPR